MAASVGPERLPTNEVVHNLHQARAGSEKVVGQIWGHLFAVFILHIAGSLLAGGAERDRRISFQDLSAHLLLQSCLAQCLNV